MQNGHQKYTMDLFRVMWPLDAEKMEWKDAQII